MALQTGMTGPELNEYWERRIRDGGADFVRFVDVSTLPGAAPYARAALFGKALSRDYIRAMRDGQTPKTKEVFNTERKMDTLALKIADELSEAGYPSVGKLKTGLLPHKTVALRAGLGFIGKNNLLVTPEYGCALMLGKVLTQAPFEAGCAAPQEPRCGDCDACVRACPGGALLGATWSAEKTREDILTRKLCSLCLGCMVCCPYTERYLSRDATLANV